MREKAKKDNEKRVKEYNKRQQKAEQAAEKEMKRMIKDGEFIDTRGTLPHRPSNVLLSLKHRMQKAGSMGNLTTVGLNGTTSQPYSALVNTGPRGASGVHKKLLARRGPTIKNNNSTDGDFKVCKFL